MTRFERLMIQYPHLDIKEDSYMPKGLSGLYFDNSIRINKRLLAYEKTGVLAEEIGHHETTHGDILDYNDTRKRKLEVLARRWGYEKIVSLDKLIQCYEARYITIEDVCTHLEITDTYLKSALEFYNVKYGGACTHKNYRITFDPLNIKPI